MSRGGGGEGGEREREEEEKVGEGSGDGGEEEVEVRETVEKGEEEVKVWKRKGRRKWEVWRQVERKAREATYFRVGRPLQAASAFVKERTRDQKIANLFRTLLSSYLKSIRYAQSMSFTLSL